MLNIDIKNLHNKKNLLAFSTGVDSSALFFLLIENNIHFDIAIVDYNTREQSKAELAHAKKMAKNTNYSVIALKLLNFTHISKKKPEILDMSSLNLS